MRIVLVVMQYASEFYYCCVDHALTVVATKCCYICYSNNSLYSIAGMTVVSYVDVDTMSYVTVSHSW